MAIGCVGIFPTGNYCMHELIHTRMLVTLGICFKQYFDTRYLGFCNLSPPGTVLPLDLLSEYRIHHDGIRPLM